MFEPPADFATTNLGAFRINAVPEPKPGDFDFNGLVDGEDFSPLATQPECRFISRLGNQLWDRSRSARRCVKLRSRADDRGAGDIGGGRSVSAEVPDDLANPNNSFALATSQLTTVFETPVPGHFFRR